MANLDIDYTAIKTRQQGMWATGDYAVIGTSLQIVGETLCEAVDVRAGSRVLDVCAGNGNASLAAARRGCHVTSTDYVGALLDAGRRRAAAEALPMEFAEADVEALPYPDASFDVVLSTFGVMFAPDQARSAAELMRVTRAGGRIGLANWTPDGFIGQMFKVLGRHVPPPAGVKPPSAWGTAERIEQLFAGAAAIRMTERVFNFRYRSPAQFVEVFRTYYGPINKAFAGLPAAAQAALNADLLELIAAHDRGDDGTMVVPSTYAEIVIDV